MTPKGGTPATQVQQHGKRTAADAPGKIVKASETNFHVEHINDTTSADFAMELDKTAFTDASCA